MDALPAPRSPITGDANGIDALQVARALVLLQGAILVATTLEALAWSGFLGPAVVPSAVLSLASAMLALGCAWALGRGPGRLARWARRWTLTAEWFVIAVALIDLGLGLAIAGSPLGLVPVLTRLGLPLGVIVILRRPAVRAGIMGVGG